MSPGNQTPTAICTIQCHTMGPVCKILSKCCRSYPKFKKKHSHKADPSAFKKVHLWCLVWNLCLYQSVIFSTAIFLLACFCVRDKNPKLHRASGIISMLTVSVTLSDRKGKYVSLGETCFNRPASVSEATLLAFSWNTPSGFLKTDCLIINFIWISANHFFAWFRMSSLNQYCILNW